MKGRSRWTVTGIGQPQIAVAAVALAVVWASAGVGHAQVVRIHEIHSDPDIKTEHVEFIELHNAGMAAVSLSGWSLTDGVAYTFPSEAAVPAGGYVVVAASPVAISSKFRVSSYGPFIGSLSNEGETLTLRDAAGKKVDGVTYQLGFPWPTVGDPPGASMQLVNPALDGDLGGSWRSGVPTPGASNVVWQATNRVPPHIRQVDHVPVQPASGQAVTITAKVTDPDGVAGVTLAVQRVPPGAYISTNDSSYATNWTSLAMRDDGQGGDALAGDAVFTATVPASSQAHRDLVRYRITAVDGRANAICVPYADDPQRNFAYFVYDGVPAWTGAARPGTDTPVIYGTNVMRRLPVYHLLAKNTDIEHCTWIDKYMGEGYPWTGTLVYDGDVYDHIGYRARGGFWRYGMGKTMWKFTFHRGHHFQARDNWGRPYASKRDKLDFSACIQQGFSNRRGEHGMYEAITFRLLNLAGVPAPNTQWLQFRVIDAAAESGTNQYEGDFWGLYLNVENVDGHFLDDHGLPDGNVYKMEEGTGWLNNQGPSGATDKSDLNAFMSGYQAYPATNWWRTNVNVDCYFSFRTIIEAVHHYDIDVGNHGKNFNFYLNPVPVVNELGSNCQWWQLPWDTDQTWADHMYGTGDEPFKHYGLLNQGALKLDYQNRIREIRDLLFNTNETYRLLDEYAAMIYPPAGGLAITGADRAMWDYNPVMNDPAHVINVYMAGQGKFYEATPSHNFPGMVQLMRDYVVHRGQDVLDPLAADAAIPETPEVWAVTNRFPVNNLVFRSSPFRDPQGSNTFAAVQWRLGEITDTNGPAYTPGDSQKYEIEPCWTSAALTSGGGAEVAVPAGVAKVGHTYRVRARMKDATGRWSHWSEPVQFRAIEPDNAVALVASLRVSELLYDPPAGSAFEFVELQNTSSNLTLDLSGVAFVNGIEYAFPIGATLPPLAHVLAVQAPSVGNFSAFRAHYGLPETVQVYGPYAGSLNNTGEKVTLKTAAAGTTISSFTYGKARGWPLAAAGAGHSLVPLALDIQADGALDYGGNWRASAYRNGSPGRADPPLPSPRLVLNEVMAHTDYLTALDSDDWIELYNPSDAVVVLTNGWFLSDDVANLGMWPIPTGTVVAARGHAWFDEITGFHASTNAGFGLNKGGDHLFLSCLAGTADDRVVDCVAFKAQENDISWGRYPDGDAWWRALAPPTTNRANAGALASVVIDELMVHPAGTGSNPEDNTNDEYIELVNPTAAAVELWNAECGPWRIDGGVGYRFPTNTVLPPDGRLVVVPFDPATNVAAREAYQRTYGLTNGQARLLGPYSGKLSNDGERVALERGVGPDLPGESTNWAIVDEVIYFDQAPWSSDADGGGAPLQRLRSWRPGNDPANWSGAYAPTPGAAAMSWTQAVAYASWVYTMPIRFDGYGKDELLVNFPALVRLSTNLPGFRYTQFASASGGDLRFSSLDGLRPLRFEIEDWDTNGASSVWVQLPELRGSNTAIMAYWGHAGATNMPTGAAWTPDYLGVWHLNAPTAPDSSVHQHASTVGGVVRQAGVVGGALAFSGTEGIRVADFGSPATRLTAMAWVWAGTRDNRNSILKNWGQTQPGRLQFGLGGGVTVRPLEAILTEADGGTVTNREGENARVHSLPVASWQHVACVADGSRLRLYRNGTEVGTAPAYDGTLCASFSPLGIGIRPNDNGGVQGEGWDGLLDEVTFASVGRSSNWVWACWLNTAPNAWFPRCGTVTARGTDQDMNGLPDAWELRYFLAVGVPGAGPEDDWDQDGMRNRDEFAAGTDPTDNTDFFRLTLGASPSGREVEFYSVRGEPAMGADQRWYCIDGATSMQDTSWSEVQGLGPICGADEWVIVTNTDSRAPMYYRGRVWIEQTPVP